MLKIGIHGAGGKMGRSVASVVGESDGAELAAGVDRSGTVGADLGTLSGREPSGNSVQAELSALAGVDVVIDFSLPEATSGVARFCQQNAIALVVGTTGVDAEGEQSLKALSQTVPVVYAPNFSQGVTLLFHLAKEATALLGDDFDAEIVEMHHRHKVDAPSGTAVRLSEVVAGAKGLSEQHLCHGRHGKVGARPQREVGVMTLRGGDVVGDHMLILAGEGERLEIGHRAHTRAIFARGAFRAAQWVVSQPAGLYGMEDVMGLRAR